MKTFLRLLVLASVTAFWLPVSESQTLGQVLRAVQNRRKLQVEQEDVTVALYNYAFPNSGQTPTYYYSLIDWGIGNDFPDDATVNGLAVSDQIRLLKQAWSEQYGDYETEELGGTISVENFPRAVRLLATIVRQDTKLPWPVFWKETDFSWVTDQLNALPQPPVPMSGVTTNSVTQTQWHPFDPLNVSVSLKGYTQSPPPVPYGVDTADTSGTSTIYASAGETIFPDSILSSAPNSFSGDLQFYQSSHFQASAIVGLTSPSGYSGDGTSNSLYHPGSYFAKKSTLSQGISPQQFGNLAGPFGGTNSNFTFPGTWYHIPNNNPGADPNYGAWYLLPTIPNQSGADFSQNQIYYSWSGGVFGYQPTLTYNAYFVPNYGQEFASTALPPPEEAPVLQIVPEFQRSRLRVRLASDPTNACELTWDFSEVFLPQPNYAYPQGALAARNIVGVYGAGKWDAVYSGDPLDREPEYDWQGNVFSTSKRWKNFDAYVSEWWQPVLKQLKTATYGLNITQQDRYTYKIDFYRVDQIGAKDQTTGHYSFTGNPAETWTVTNPTNDDAQAGKLQITTSTAVYNVTLTQTLNSNNVTNGSQWSWTVAPVGTTAPLLSKSVAVSRQAKDSYSSVTHVVDTTTLDGQALPTVTTDYRLIANPERIDTISEAGADGTRTTSFFYDWEMDDYGNYYIDHLTGITQTGGLNPYSATYDDNELLTDFVSGSSEIQIGYSGSNVTRTELFNGSTVRTTTTAYTGGLTAASSTMGGISDAPPAQMQRYDGSDGTNPWGVKLVRGFDGTLTTYSYAWSGSDFVTTITQGPESSSNPGTVAAGTQTVVKTNVAGKAWSTVVTDLQSNLTVDFATATAYQGGNTPFPSTFSRPLNTNEQYVYDGQGRVTSHTDQLGLAQSFTLDALGRVTQSTRNGLTWNIAYNQNALGRTINTTDGTNTRTRTETTSPFGSSQTVAITGPENVTTTRTETSGSTGTITTTVQNSTTAQTKTETIQKQDMSTAVGGNATEPWKVTYSFPGSGWQQIVTHGSDAALTATTTYDALGRVKEEDTPSPTGSGTSATTYVYTGGRLSAATDPAGSTQYAYQPDGSLGQMSRGARNVTVARAQGDGSSIGWVWTDATGETLWQQNYYPSSGVTKDLPWGESARAVTSTPTITGSVLSTGTTGPNGSETASWQDGIPSSGSLTSGAATTGWTAQGSAFGDVTSQTVKPGNIAANALTTSFDAYNLPNGTTGLVATNRANSFDGSGNFTSVLTRNGHTLTGKLSSEGEDLGTTGYGVPDAPWSTPSYGSTITRTLSSGAGNAQFTYNLAGALQQRQFPDGSAENFAYDGSGALSSWTTPRASFSFVPNAFGQPTQIGGMGTLGYDGAGRVNSVSDPADTYTQTYTDGQPFVQAHTGGVLAGQSVERDYDNLGRLQTLKLPGNVAVGYTYNGPNGALSGVTTAGGASGTWTNFDAVMGVGKNFTLGPLSTVSVWDGLGRGTSLASTAGGSTLTYTHGYDADGHCNTANTPNGSWAYGFDPSTGWLHTAQGPQNFTYNFDEAGRPASATDWRPTVRLNLNGVAIFGSVTPGATVQVINGTATTPVPANATTGQFSLNLAGVSSGWQTYTTRGTLAHAGTNGTDAVADAVNQVFVPPSSESLGYDASGNRGGDARWTQTWNSLDRMASMVEANPASTATKMEVDCLYDLQGRRVQKTVSVGGAVTKRTTTLWDGWRPVMEIDYTGVGGGESARRYYTWGPDVSGSLDGAAGIGGLLEIVEKKGGAVTTSLPVYDGVGNVVGLVDGSSGVSVATYQYGPFGEVLGVYGPRAASCPFHYQTRLYDDETGLSYFGKRYYDAKTQTWLSRDPLREDGGVNLYAYCGNDPVSSHDPVGLLTQEERDLLTQNNTAAADILARYGGPNVRAVTPGDILSDGLRTYNLGLSNPGVAIPLYPLSIPLHYLLGIRTDAKIPLDSKARLHQQYPGENDDDIALLESARQNSVRAKVALAQRGLLPKGDLQRLRLRVLDGMLDLTTIAASIPFQAPGIGAELSVPLADTNALVQSIEQSAAAKGAVNYGALDSLGRPTGVTATITEDMIGTGSPASRSIIPPGFRGGAAGQARGHLLGNQLGGSGTEVRNLVTLQQNPANSPVMRGFENQIRAAVEGGQIFRGSFTPVYLGNNLVPRGITITGEGSGGFSIGVSVLNPDGLY